MSQTALVQAFIRRALRAHPQFAARLPGGIHFGDAPARTRYPFLRCVTSGGPDLTAVGSGVIGGHLFYLVMVVDRADHSDRADGLGMWIESSMVAASGALVELSHELPGETVEQRGWVYCRKETSLATPVWQQGTQYQQVGGTYRFWVDAAEGA